MNFRSICKFRIQSLQGTAAYICNAQLFRKLSSYWHLSLVWHLRRSSVFNTPCFIPKRDSTALPLKAEVLHGCSYISGKKRTLRSSPPLHFSTWLLLLVNIGFWLLQSLFFLTGREDTQLYFGGPALACWHVSYIMQSWFFSNTFQITYSCVHSTHQDCNTTILWR